MQICTATVTCRLSDSKYGSQSSPTTNSLVQPLHTEMADKGALTVFTATHSFSQDFAKKILQAQLAHIIGFIDYSALHILL